MHEMTLVFGYIVGSVLALPVAVMICRRERHTHLRVVIRHGSVAYAKADRPQTHRLGSHDGSHRQV